MGKQWKSMAILSLSAVLVVGKVVSTSLYGKVLYSHSKRRYKSASVSHTKCCMACALPAVAAIRDLTTEGSSSKAVYAGL